jgi:2-hydroxychromene-2-carboxylate isomerase
MAAHHIDFWFTMGSTYSYLSVSRLADVERSTGVTFRWRPFHLLIILQEMKHVPFADKPTKSPPTCGANRPSEIDGFARTLPQQAAERALLAASRRRSLSIAQAA